MAETIDQIIDAIDDLVAEAQTCQDRDRRTRLTEQALKKICQFMKRLNRRMVDYSESVFQSFDISNEHATLPFRDFAFSDDQFQIFRSSAALNSFLTSSEEVLVQQGFLTRKKIHKFITETRSYYDQAIDQKLDVNKIVEKFKRLERLFCRPPYDGGGGSPLLGDDANAGPSETRTQKICRWIQTIAAIGTVIGWYFVSKGAQNALRKEHDNLTVRSYALISLLFMAAVSDAIDEVESIPLEIYHPVDVEVIGRA